MEHKSFANSLLGAIMSSDYWAGSEKSIMALVMALNSSYKGEGAPASMQVLDGEEDRFGGQYSYMLNKYDDIAVLDIRGSIIPYESPYNKYFGVVSYEEIRNAAITAMRDESVSKILLKIDSPGGAVNGVDECVDALNTINERHMPIYTFTSGMMCSAGYFLGSVGRKIFTTKLTIVGSVGAMRPMISVFRQLKDNGIDVKVIRSPDKKALGHQFDEMSDEAVADVQEGVNLMARLFEEGVAQNRGTSVELVRANYGGGTTFIGEQAVTNGLADEVSTFDKVLSRLKDSNSTFI